MLPLRVRLSYGIGGAVYAVKEAAYTVFILLFYTQVLGLSGAVTGTVVALSLVWDAVSDPLVGMWSDRLRSRYGRRHPFMVYSTLPLALGFIGLFSPPSAVIGSSLWLACWLLFWSLWVRTFTTLFSIPHLALSAEISADYHERSRVLALRMGSMFLCAVLLPAVALLLIFAQQDGVDGRFDRHRYPLYGLLSCALVLALSTLTVWGTRRHVSQPDIPDRPVAARPVSPRLLLLDFVRTLRNRTFRRIIGYEIAIGMAWGCLGTLNMFAWIYVWEFSAIEISIILSVPSLLAVVLVILAQEALGRRLDKHRLLQLALAGLLLDALWLYPLWVMDLLPPNDSAVVFACNLLLMLLWMFFFLLRSVNSTSIVADLTDEHELDHGLRQEGGFFAVVAFAWKLASVFGPLFGGYALQVIGLEEGMLPGTVPRQTLEQLVYAMGIGILPALLAAFYLALGIDMGRQRLADIQAAIAERRRPAD
jgi:GPH family glycoside/pentoside/hexuronide:cation symporter